jgi:type II secretory pathway pseudopilin PulG
MRQGFTLVELIIAIAGFTIIILGVVSLTSNVFTTNRQQGTLLADQDQARKLAFTAMTELRNGVASNVGAYALAEASAQQLTFYSDIDGGTDVERIRYFLQNGELKKGIVKPTGNPLAYNFGTETITTVQKNVANGANPIFYYYDGSYTGVTENPLAQPVNVTSVKLVKISLDISNKAGVRNTNKYTVTAIGAVRSLKTNLGN